MGRAPCCEKVGLKRGRWTAEEDEILTNYIQANGEGSWRSLPKNAGLLRCGKSCRLRWINYLKSDVKRGNISEEEEEIIIRLHATIGNRWSLIAGNLPGRTDNEIKNYWNSHLSRKIHSFRRPTIGSAETASVLIADAARKVAMKKRRGGRISRAAMKKNKTRHLAKPPPPELSDISTINGTDETNSAAVQTPTTPILDKETLTSTNSWNHDSGSSGGGGSLSFPEIIDFEHEFWNESVDDWLENSQATDEVKFDWENLHWEDLAKETRQREEEENVMSWMWETSGSGGGGYGEEDCDGTTGEKQNALLDWLFS